MQYPDIHDVPGKGYYLRHNMTKHRISPYMESHDAVMEFAFENDLNIDNMMSYSDDDVFYQTFLSKQINQQHHVQAMD